MYNINGKMIFIWAYNKNRELKMLSQSVQSEEESVMAVYNGSKTKVLSKSYKEIIYEDFIGLKEVKVLTKMGKLLWNYE